MLGIVKVQAYQGLPAVNLAARSARSGGEGDLMRVPPIPVAVLVMGCVLGLARSGEAQCLPDGDVWFVCGPVSPEDLAVVPGSPWVIGVGL